jgi:isopentenyl-diphosphate Delta-isomerase
VTENIYFVDKYDEPTGEISEKLTAHNSDTKLHAAFSCYVFNDAGQFLVTKRASTKKVWPTVWTNSCCGHPMPNESRKEAINRRLLYELGLRVYDIELILDDYTYRTPPYKGIIEHEFCPLYVARTSEEPSLNPKEVAAYKWVDWSWFVEQAKGDSDDYSNPDALNSPVWSWWCKDQLSQLQTSIKFQEFLAILSR